MPRTGWHNLNENRNYPFTEPGILSYRFGSTLAPIDVSALVTDAGITVGPAVDPYPFGRTSGETKRDIILSSINVFHESGTPSQVTFIFSVSGLSASYSFTVPADADGATVYATATDPQIGNGFITVGKISEIIPPRPGSTGSASFTPDTGTSPAVLEPALVTWRYKHVLRRIFIGNEPMTPPALCMENPIPDVPGGYSGGVVTRDMDLIPPILSSGNAGTPLKTCPDSRTIKINQQGNPITGVLRFIPGYNCGVRTESESNTIEIEALLGDGEGSICPKSGQDDPWDDLEIAKNGAIIPTDHTCDELVYSINGIPPDDDGNFRIDSGTGIVIRPDSGLDVGNNLNKERTISGTPEFMDWGGGCSSYSLVIEGEDGAPHGGVSAIDHDLASQGRVMRFSTRQSESTFQLSHHPADRSRYNLIIPATIPYAVWMRVWPPPAHAFGVGLRFHASAGALNTPLNIGRSTFYDIKDNVHRYLWVRLYRSTSATVRAPWEIVLPRGAYDADAFTFSPQVASNLSEVTPLYLDQILITSNTRYVPTCAE